MELRLLLSFQLFLLSAYFSRGQEVIRVGVIIDHGVDVAGERILDIINDMKPELQENMTEYIDFDFVGKGAVHIDDLKMEISADNLTAVLMVLDCHMMQETVQILQNEFPATYFMAIPPQDCPRPPGIQGVSFPLMMSDLDIVPILKDIRMDLLQRWTDIVIVHDNSIDIDYMESIVSVFMMPGYAVHPASVTTFDLCAGKTECKDHYDTIISISEIYRSSDYKTEFIAIGREAMIKDAIKILKRQNMLTVGKQWLTILTDRPPFRSLEEEIENLPAETNMAIAYREDTDECSMEKGCQLKLSLQTFAEAIGAIYQDFYNDFENEIYYNTMMRRNRISFLVRERLTQEQSCGGCIKFAVKSTALRSNVNPDNAGYFNALETIGRWTPFAGIKMSTFLFPWTAGNFRGRNIKIGVLHASPLAIVEPTKGRKLKVRGVVAELVRALAETLNFTYEWREPKDKQFGIKQRDGEWSGLIGDVINKDIEFAAQGFYMTQERLTVVNFTVAIDEDPYAILMRRPTQAHEYLFLAPFTYDTWGCVFAAVVIIGPIINIIHRLSKYYDYNNLRDGKGLFSLYNCAWYSYGALVQQGGIHLPLALSGRMIIGFWWLFVIVTVTTYSGNLVAVLTFPKIRNPIDSVTDMLNYGSGLRWATFEGEALVEFLKNSRGEELAKLGKKITTYRRDDFDEALTKILKKKFVFLAARSKLIETQSAEHNRTGKCQFSISHKDILREPSAMPVPKNWPYLDRVNLEITRYVETGLITRWNRAHQPPDNECTVESKPQAGDTRKIDVDQMMGSFFLLGIGCLFAFISLVLEVLYRRIIRPRLKPSKPVVAPMSERDKRDLALFGKRPESDRFFNRPDVVPVNEKAESRTRLASAENSNVSNRFHQSNYYDFGKRY